MLFTYTNPEAKQSLSQMIHKISVLIEMAHEDENKLILFNKSDKTQIYVLQKV